MNIKFVCIQQRTWFFVHRRTSSWFASINERDSLYTEEHQVGLQATTNVILCTPKNIKFVCKQQRTWLSLHGMNIKFICNQQRTWFFVHRRTSSLFASINERDSLHTEEHQVGLQATTSVILCTPKNIKFVCKQQRTWLSLHWMNIKFVCNQQRTWLSLPHPPQPPLNPYGLRGIKYTWMRYSIGGSAIKVAREQGDGAWNKVHHPPNNMFFHHPTNNIILVCNPQRTSLPPPPPHPLSKQIHHPPKNIICVNHQQNRICS